MLFYEVREPLGVVEEVEAHSPEHAAQTWRLQRDEAAARMPSTGSRVCEVRSPGGTWRRFRVFAILTYETEEEERGTYGW